MPEYDRYYRIEPLGKKWATVCYADGFKAMVCVSKNKRAAKRKGDDYLAGKRNARRRYVTAYGERINTMKSCIPRNARMISGGAPITHAQFAALFPSLYPPTTKEE